MLDRDMHDMWELIGVSPFDHSVYRSVVTQPLADHAGEHESPDRVRDALERLASLGLLRPADTPTGYEAVEPRAGLGALVRERRGALDRIEAASHDLSRTFAASLLRTEPRRLFDIIEGPEAIAARIHDLLGMAHTEAVGIDTPPYIAASSAQVSDAELQLLRRGVHFRALYASEVLDEPALVARIHWMAEQGEHARVLPRVPMKLLIVDGESAVVPLTVGAAGNALSVVAARSALTDGLQAMFEELWTQASPIHIGMNPRRPGRGDATAEQLLNLLAAGMKDESIARHLGISARTLRRRVATLLDSLDATGRFQAGVNAAKRSWL